MPHLGTLAALLARGTIGSFPTDARAQAAAIGWKAVEGMLTKAAVGENVVGFAVDSGTGVELSGFVGSLRGLSLAAEVQARAQQWPLHSRVGMLAESGFAAAEMNEEQQIAPVLLTNGVVTITPSRVSAICVYSEELLASRGAADAIEADLRKAIGRGLDKALLTRIQPGSAGGFGATSSAPADIKELVSLIAVTGNEPLVFGAAVDVNITAATLYQDGEEVFEEVNLVGMGAYKGVPWLPTDQIGAGTLVCVDPSGLAFVIQAVDIQVGKSAALFQDSAPAGAQQLTSMFQTNSIAVRADCRFACQVMRERDVSAECTSIAWASS